MKKGISLIEILIAIAIVAFIAQKTLSAKTERQFLDEIDGMITKITALVSVGIYDTFKGYTTSGGGNCSSSYDVINISAKRIKLCTNIPYPLVDNTTGDNTDATKSFFSFLDSYSRTTHGCMVYVDDFDDFTSRLFINCSGLDSKYHAMIEEKLSKQLSKNLQLIYKTTYFNAIGFSNLTSGNKNDGFIILEFQK